MGPLHYTTPGDIHYLHGIAEPLQFREPPDLLVKIMKIMLTDLSNYCDYQKLGSFDRNQVSAQHLLRFCHVKNY